MKKIILSIWLMLLLYPSILKADEQNHYCLVEAIYFEGRSESRTGQLAIANVILERVRQDYYPDTICEVVHEWKGYPRLNTCSFSYFCDGKKEIMYEKQAHTIAADIATLAIEGAVVENVWRATHYHTRHINPYWVEDMFLVGTVGAHLFYERSY